MNSRISKEEKSALMISKYTLKATFSSNQDAEINSSLWTELHFQVLRLDKFVTSLYERYL